MKLCFSLILFLCFFSSRFVYSNISDVYYRVADISMFGAEKTKPEILLREFEYSVGDSIKMSMVETAETKFENNLRRLMLFNDVKVSHTIDSSQIYFNVQVEERWYYWFYPILENADRNLTSYFYYRNYNKINYGAAFDWLNFRGRNEMLNFKIRLGYKEHYSVSYQKKNLGKQRKSGLWINAEYFRQKQVISGIFNNKPIYTENPDTYVKNILNLGLGYVFRPQINYDFTFALKYQNIVYKDSLFYMQIPYRQYFVIPDIEFDYDNRNNLVYPTYGFHVNAGIAAFADIADSRASYSFAKLEAEYNLNIFRERAFYKCNFSYKKIIGNNQKISADKIIDLCKDYTIRGYDYYYIAGTHFESLENTISVKICDKKTYKIKSPIPEKFRNIYIRIYADFFADIAYCGIFARAFDSENSLSGKAFYSTGLGISVETYYDRLFQFYVAYIEHFNSFGVFINYKTPIYKKFK